MKKIIIYGDIHGCFDEFMQLRQQLNPTNNDIEICVGDILNKGPKSLETLRFIQKHNIYSVMGNHEYELLQVINENKESDKIDKALLDALTPNDITFLESLPYVIKIASLTIVHAGVDKSISFKEEFSKKQIKTLLNVRYLDDEGFWSKEEDATAFWANHYKGELGFIVYGHTVRDVVKPSTFALGIDTGCVHGGSLSAAIVTQYDTISDISYTHHSLCMA